MRKTIETTCFKFDKPNAKALILGFDKNGTSIHQSIYCDVRKRHYPMLITYNKSPSRFPLSKLGNDLNNDNRQLKMKYIVDFVAEYFIHNKIELWNIICNNGLFDIWLPEAPFKRFNISTSDAASYRIVLLRIYEIEEEFYESDITHASARIDQIKEKSILEVTIKRPIIDDLTFNKTKNLLENSINSYLSIFINFDKFLSNEESVYELPFIEENEELTFPEGKEKYILHKSKERNNELVRKVKELNSKKDNKLSCQICGFSFLDKYGEIGKGFIEAHHTFPISELKEETNTKIEDLAMLCSNCHRMVHRRRPWLTIEELNEIKR